MFVSELFIYLKGKCFVTFFFLFRYISKEILTIREAVWLTDNTYKYEDLVRMMGEVISVLEGNIRVNTTSIVCLVYCLVFGASEVFPDLL